MSKLICDICGTTYQDTADCCPICGCSKDAAADLLSEELLTEDFVEEPKGKNGRASSKKKKQIFDYDEVNTHAKETEDVYEEEENPYEEEEEYEEQPRHNTFIVILLTILIAALLIAAGFIFVRYFLPNMGGEEETIPSTVEVQTEQATETTELRIPCELLTLKSGMQAELTEVGFSHLINVILTPEDTTDELVFVSADESVATVTADGRITAVGEGETVVTITCGDVQMFVNVICDFTPETVPTTEAEEATGETTDETTGETVGETTDETSAESEDEGSKEIDPNITLKLKKTDISLGVYYQFRLELDCDLDPKDVEWSSEHPYIATVDEEGVVTAVKSGTTAIIAKYGDQEVQCIVRCS